MASDVGALRWEDDSHVEVAGVRFALGFDRGGTAEQLNLWKTVPLVEQYVALLAEVGPRRVVELGVAEGGSAALVALLARPEVLVAVDLDDRPRPGLDAVLAAHALDAAVHLVYGVDQADVVSLRRVVDGHLRGQPIDVVFDDASHLLGPTRASFEALFPRVRPGGLYVVEDWAWEHVGADRVAAALGPEAAGGAGAPLVDRIGAEEIKLLSGGRDEEIELDGQFASLRTGAALSDLAIELMLVRARGGDVVRSVRIDGDWIVVERGAAVLDDGFRLDACYADHFGVLARRPVSGVDG